MPQLCGCEVRSSLNATCSCKLDLSAMKTAESAQSTGWEVLVSTPISQQLWTNSRRRFLCPVWRGGHSKECWRGAALEWAPEPEPGKWAEETELSSLYGHHDRGEETKEDVTEAGQD